LQRPGVQIHRQEAHVAPRQPLQHSQANARSRAGKNNVFVVKFHGKYPAMKGVPILSSNSQYEFDKTYPI
jgi:hypothetical protein